jgi:hypothetical protein
MAYHKSPGLVISQENKKTYTVDILVVLALIQTTQYNKGENDGSHSNN